MKDRIEMADPLRSLAWKKARIVLGHDHDKWRKDDFGNWVSWDQYGDRSSRYGWVIDHVEPTFPDGLNNVSNVRALHWRASTSLGGALARQAQS